MSADQVRVSCSRSSCLGQILLSWDNTLDELTAAGWSTADGWPVCGSHAYATSADRPTLDGQALDGTGEAPRIAAERLSTVDPRDRAREAVRDLLGPPVGSMPGIQRMVTESARLALESLLVEAYRRGVERGERTGRATAADALAEWAERVEPIQPGVMPSRLRRTLARAVQVVAPEPTVGEVAAALVGVLDELRDRAAHGERPAVAVPVADPPAVRRALDGTGWTYADLTAAVRTLLEDTSPTESAWLLEAPEDYRPRRGPGRRRPAGGEGRG